MCGLLVQFQGKYNQKQLKKVNDVLVIQDDIFYDDVFYDASEDIAEEEEEASVLLETAIGEEDE